jgi:uroporphyrinogen-III synthase
VTRPRAQADDWVQRLRGHGVDAVALPLIEIASSEHPELVRAAWNDLPHCGAAVFVSPNAVEQFFALRPAQASWPAEVLAATTGPGSDAALDKAGVPAAQRIAPRDDAAQFDSESLWGRIKDRPWNGARVLIVRGDGGREWLAERFREAGAQVDFVAAYHRCVPTLNAEAAALLRRAIEQPATHCWFFSSSEAVDHLKALCASHGLEPQWPRARALATHPRIAERARRLGCGHIEQLPPSIEGVVRALARE